VVDVACANSMAGSGFLRMASFYSGH